MKKKLSYNFISKTDTMPLRALWQSVIMQAVIDIKTIPDDKYERIDRRKTLAWFSMMSKDFVEVCDLADFEPSVVIKNVKILIREKHFCEMEVLYQRLSEESENYKLKKSSEEQDDAA